MDDNHRYWLEELNSKLTTLLSALSQLYLIDSTAAATVKWKELPRDTTLSCLHTQKSFQDHLLVCENIEHPNKTSLFRLAWKNVLQRYQEPDLLIKQVPFLYNQFFRTHFNSAVTQCTCLIKKLFIQNFCA